MYKWHFSDLYKTTEWQFPDLYKTAEWQFSGLYKTAEWQFSGLYLRQKAVLNEKGIFIIVAYYFRKLRKLSFLI